MNKYQSCMGGGEITAAQFVMEKFLLLLASQEKTNLPEKFWQLDKYKQLWKRHVRSVHKLLKVYEVEAITSGLKDRRLKNLRSLSQKAAWLWKPVFDKHQKIVEEKLKAKNSYEEPDVADVNPANRRITNKPSKLQQLRDL
jgi:hypothetical protein